MIMKLKFFDFFIISLFIGIIVLISVSTYNKGGEAESVIIEAEGKSSVYMLDTDRRIEAPGPLGNTIVIIENREVFVEDSPCRDKLCVIAGPISKPGEWNACMPNKVFIRIPESTQQEIDSISY